jgi:hypothetical protein
MDVHGADRFSSFDINFSTIFYKPTFPSLSLSSPAQPRKFDIRDVPIPTIDDNELLLKGASGQSSGNSWS